MQYRQEAFAAIERQTHADVGTLHVVEPLPAALPLAAPQTSLRPQRRVRVCGFPLDKEDHYFDRTEPLGVNVLPGRIQRVARLSPSEPGNRRLLVTCDDVFAHDYKGSPILTDQGEVIGVFSRPTPPPDPESAKQPTTLDVVLIERLREMLSKQ